MKRPSNSKPLWRQVEAPGPDGVAWHQDRVALILGPHTKMPRFLLEANQTLLCRQFQVGETTVLPYRCWTARVALSLVALQSLIHTGCGEHATLPADATATSKPAGAVTGSLFSTKTIPVQAMWPNPNGTPEPIGLTINGSPQSAVHQALEQARIKHAEIARSIERRIEAVRADLAKERDRLSETNATVSVEYNEKVPERSEAMSRTARSSLKNLSKARAQKTEADDWLREAHASRIVPIERSINSLEAERSDAESRLNSHLASLPQVEFAALPRPPHKTWNTSRLGEDVLTIPPGEPWVFWAEHKGTHWVLTSSNLDANGKLTFNEKTGSAVGPSSILSKY